VRGILGLLIVFAIAASGFAQEPKARTYALAFTPLEIYDRLPTLNMGAVPRLSDDERKLLAKIWGQRAKKPTAPLEIDDALLLEAVLFASGIEEFDARDKYGKQFNTLVAKARDTVNDAKHHRQRGEQLMKFLHASVMSKGYEASQTSFANIFDMGQFNCVSSTAMYYLVGKRLGMELRPISIPGSGFLAGHASLDMVEGNNRIQVEPTNPDGFDWQAKVNRPGVIVLGFVPDRKDAHEVDELGIAAMIYSNRGVALTDEKSSKRLEAIRCYLAALTLDPADESATNNLLSVFVNWGPALIAEKQFDDAIRVLAFGLTIAPQSDALHNNHRIAWAEHIEATLKSGKDNDALRLIEQAATAVPNDKDFQSASHWFSRLGEKLIEEKGWEAGLAIVERGSKVLPESELGKLREWRSSVFRRWSQSLLDNADADGSLKVLARAYALEPTDKEIVAGIAYHTKEALVKMEGKGLAPMVDHFKALREQFPNLDEVSEGGALHAARAIEKLADNKTFKEGVDAVEKYRPLFTKPEQRATVGGIAYDRWGRHLAGIKEWKAALDKYVEGLKAYPKEERLTSNAIATVDEWAAPAIEAKNWDEAIRIYRVGLEYFPGNSHLLDNKRYCEKMKENWERTVPLI
jgi:tetratricopeptide (TPR) repeat protein